MKKKSPIVTSELSSPTVKVTAGLSPEEEAEAYWFNKAFADVEPRSEGRSFSDAEIKKAYLAGFSRGGEVEREKKEGIIADRDAKSQALAADVIGKAQAIEAKLAEKDARIAELEHTIERQGREIQGYCGQEDLIVSLKQERDELKKCLSQEELAHNDIYAKACEERAALAKQLEQTKAESFSLRTTLEAVEKERDELREGLREAVDHFAWDHDSPRCNYDCPPPNNICNCGVQERYDRLSALLASREEKK